ncbi:polysaccharide deacetylase family protein [Streptomyces tropicalis]|uniref:Polysaccharide deacetylase family protein n=1 Tax=Streptomyces tropicalis TaxID=3034234 RepID=A0ABT6AAK7_9ACTN|nr:polysaccharide deacetylase family protein [Streptomyces tropicalis]MDF3301688.1 polysaccharide deacetylase family protein [Streptomyces tropicalis]
MSKDQLFTRRRALLAGAAALGAGAGSVAGLRLAGTSGGTGTRSPVPAAGPRAHGAPESSTFRLQPLTGGAPPHARPPRTPVRTAPLLSMPGPGRPMVLTFDDGPDPRYTPHILDTLAKHDIRATFFVCGGMADAHRGLLARMADEGHVVGNHTWTHPLLTRLDRAAIRAEIERTSEVIEKAYGEPPQWFRAPYGAWNRATFQLNAELGMEPLAWSLDSFDWTTPVPGTDRIVRQVEYGAAPGVVLLSHDAGGDRSHTVEALRVWLPKLLKNGFHFTVPRRPSG